MPICPKCREKNPALGARCPRDGYYYIYDSAFEEAQNDPFIGTLAADKYVVLDLISEGGMGAVYRALQLPVEREIALKVLRTELQDSNQGRERFIQEARAISRLSHPNIITLHDFGFAQNDQPYMVMEYAPGQELTKWLHNPGMNAHRLVHVIRQILSALAEAHQNNVIHRDLKPENVIVTRAGNDDDFPKLLDFGIARLINEGATRGLTREGEVFGTPHYMSPEQAQGKRSIGPPSDVYAMGIMLHEFFTGEPPYDAEAPLSVLFMHINDPMPELIPRKGITLPKGIAGVVARATEKAPEDRYDDALEMLTALDEALGLGDTSQSFSLPAGAAGNSAKNGISTPSPETSQSTSLDTKTTDMTAAVGASGNTKKYGPSASPEPDPEAPTAPVSSPTIDDVEESPKLGTSTDVEDTLQTDRPKSRIALFIAAAVFAVMLAATIVTLIILFGGNDSSATNAEVAEAAPAAEETEPSPEEDPEDAPESAREPAAEDDDEDEEAIADPEPQEDSDDLDEPADEASAEESEPTPEVEETPEPPAEVRSAPRPTVEERPAPSSPPEPEPEEEPESDDEADEEDSAPSAPEPGLFERPANRDDDGPAKFDRPAPQQ